MTLTIPNLPTCLWGTNARPDDSIYVVDVTPDLATLLLSMNTDRNRRPSKTKVAEYAEHMANGKFTLTHQCLMISDKGTLEDGQHRLLAVLESGMTVRMRICVGDPADNFLVIDQGLRRLAQQFIKAYGTTFTGASRIIGVATGTTDASTIRDGYRADNQSNERTLDIVEKWLPELNKYVLQVNRIAAATRITASPHLAVVCLASTTPYAGRLDEWLGRLEDGVVSSGKDPRLVLRNRFMRDFNGLSRGNKNTGYSFMVKAWNSFALGKEMSILRHRDDEETPAIVGFQSALQRRGL